MRPSPFPKPCASTLHYSVLASPSSSLRKREFIDGGIILFKPFPQTRADRVMCRSSPMSSPLRRTRTLSSSVVYSAIARFSNSPVGIHTQTYITKTSPSRLATLSQPARRIKGPQPTQPIQRNLGHNFKRKKGKVKF